MYTNHIDANGKLVRISVTCNDELWQIPIDTANSEYQKYLDWLKSGNMPDIKRIDLFPASNEPTPEERLAALELVVSMVFAEDDANV